MYYLPGIYQITIRQGSVMPSQKHNKVRENILKRFLKWLQSMCFQKRSSLYALGVYGSNYSNVNKISTDQIKQHELIFLLG